MLFSSLPFLFFFVIAFIVYYLLPGNKQWWFLLLSGLGFYLWSDPFNIWVPLVIVAITWYTGKHIEQAVNEQTKKKYLSAGIICNLIVLIGFKYTYFFISIAAPYGKKSALLSFFNQVAIPLGISYITFQAIGYLVDIHNGKTSTQKNIIPFAGYLLFFPKMVAGPVENARHFLPQMEKPVSFEYDRVTSAMRQFGWGLFKKLVIADRLGLFVNSVYADVYHNTGISLLIAVFLFPIQLYADFSGYTDMALGLSKMLGYELTPNFNNPFSAKSMVEFWRKWHISLSTWFNEYLYTPLVIKKRDWGKWSVVYASMVTFLTLGLWHGPNWTFVIFGGIQGCLISIELFTGKWRKRIRKNFPETLNNISGMAYVFILFAFSCIFFRSENLTDAGYLISHLFSGTKDFAMLKLSLQSHELGVMDYVVALVTIPCMFYIENKGLQQNISYSPKWIRWSVYYLFLIVIIVYGITHSGFIYTRF